MDTKYEAPRIADAGSLAELTESINKTGKKPDAYTAAIEAAIGVSVIGSAIHV